MVPGQQSANEGFRKGGSLFCCAFRHPDERKAVVDAWESTTTDVLGQNANLRCQGHVSTQAAWQAALLPRVLVGSSNYNGISLAARAICNVDAGVSKL